MNNITVSELPKTIQILLTEAQQTGESLTITKDGIPLAVIQPIKKSARASFGAMKHRGKVTGNIVEPSSNLVSWDALS